MTKHGRNIRVAGLIGALGLLALANAPGEATAATVTTPGAPTSELERAQRAYETIQDRWEQATRPRQVKRFRVLTVRRGARWQAMLVHGLKPRSTRCKLRRVAKNGETRVWRCKFKIGPSGIPGQPVIAFAHYVTYGDLSPRKIGRYTLIA